MVRGATLQVVIGLVLAASGCGGDSASDSCADTVTTPGGPIARQCVHEVPSGGSVVTDDAGTTSIVVDGKVVESFGPCPCAASASGGPPPLGEFESGTEE